jgi:hypothetical protein
MRMNRCNEKSQGDTLSYAARQEHNRASIYTVPVVEGGLGVNVAIFQPSFLTFMDQVIPVAIGGGFPQRERRNTPDSSTVIHKDLLQPSCPDGHHKRHRGQHMAKAESLQLAIGQPGDTVTRNQVIVRAEGTLRPGREDSFTHREDHCLTNCISKDAAGS